MKKFMILSMSMATALGLASAAQAQQDSGFTPHHLVPGKDYANYAERLPDDAKLELRGYLDYEQREQCQGYRPPPEGFFEAPDACDLTYREMRRMRATQVTQIQQEDPIELRPVVSDYEVNFDFDEAEVRPAEQDTIQQVVQDIRRYNPYEVTVIGHADRAGPPDYNVALSQRRAQNVSQALAERGIPNRVLDQAARGENDPAIPTNDGVRLEENRRAEIQFRR